jgi:hypothetical protein
MPDSPVAQLALILPWMARLDLTDEERDELVRALRGLIAMATAFRCRRGCAVCDGSSTSSNRRRPRPRCRFRRPDHRLIAVSR